MDLNQYRKGEGGVSENDVMGVAIRPRPVGDRREWLLVEVCRREGRGTEEGVWLLSRPLLPDKTLSTRQHSGQTDGRDGHAAGMEDGWRVRQNTNRPFEEIKTSCQTQSILKHPPWQETSFGVAERLKADGVCPLPP